MSLKGTQCTANNPFTLHCWAKVLFLMKSRSYPALLKARSGSLQCCWSCHEAAAESKPGAYSLGHSPHIGAPLGEMPSPWLGSVGFGRQALANLAVTPGGVSPLGLHSSPLPQIVVQEQSILCAAACQPKTWRPDPGCKRADVCLREKHTLTHFSCLSSEHESDP